MKIKFKDRKEIEFKKFGNMLLAESVIWEDTDLHGSLEELRKLKARVNAWFKRNAPKEICEKYKVRLPLWKEIKLLQFKDQIAYMEGETNQIINYFLGDEDGSFPIYYSIGYMTRNNGRYMSVCYSDWGVNGSQGVRLLLEEK